MALQTRITVLTVLIAATLTQAMPYPVEHWAASNPGVTVYGWRQYPLFSGGNLWRVKNDSHFVIIDDLGDEVDGEAISTEDKSHEHSVNGALTTELVAAMAAYPSKAFLVSITPYNVRPADWEHATTEYDRAAMRTLVANHVSSVLSPILIALDEVSATPLVVGDVSPIIYVELDVGQLNGLKQNEYIDTIELESQSSEINFARSDIWWSGRGTRISEAYAYATGVGQTVAIVEKGTLRSYASAAEHHNQLLQGGQILGSDVNLDSTCADPDDHTSWVAGFVSAAHPTDATKRSGAYNARVVAANACLRNFELDSLEARYAAAERMSAFGADQSSTPVFPFVYNHSYGDNDAYLRFGGGGWIRAIDYRSKWLLQTEVVACGNAGVPIAGFPNGKPVACRGLNSVNVGGYDDMGTPKWTDDGYFVAYGGPYPLNDKAGNWVNGFGNTSDRELPELAGPAVLIESTEQSTGSYSTTPEPDRIRVGPAGHTGTSMAAPLIASFIAMIHEYSPISRFFPTDAKAVLLASSVHSINNDPPPDFGAQKIGGLYTADRRVGAGAISGASIGGVLDESRGGFFHTQTANNSWHPATAGWRELGVPIPQIDPSEPRLRVVLTWSGEATCRLCGNYDVNDSHTAASFGERWYLPTDLDLVVADSLGNLAAQSISFDNSYEIVDFDTTAFSAPFHVYVRAHETGAISNEVISLAWFSYTSSADEGP